MMNKKNGGKKSNKKKISLFKLSNKKLNKLAKQGKLKKAVGKKSLVTLLKDRTSGVKKKNAIPERVNVVEKDIPLREADYEYYSKPGRNFDFLANLPKYDEENKGKKKNKRKHESYHNEAELAYEKRMKIQQDEYDVKNQILPTKSKKNKMFYSTVKIVKPSENEEEKELENHEDDPVSDDEPEQVEKTFVEEFIERKIAKVNARKTISEISASIIESGTENVGKISEILACLEMSYPMSIRKLAMTSLFEVFKDIIPDYTIRVLTETEKHQTMKRETKQLLAYEEALLIQYKKYLDTLDEFSKGHIGKEKSGNNEKFLRQKKLLKRKSVTYLGDLLVSHPHFNFRTIIITAIVRSMFNHDTKTSDLACNAVTSVFTQDKDGDVILETVRLIGRSLKAGKYKAKPKVLNTFLSLKIKNIGDNKEEDRRSAAEMRKKNAAMSKKERKRQKEMRNLEKELQQVAAEDNKKLNRRLHTEIISNVFLTYFRILKLYEPSVLLPSVLEGLAKFAHLINVSYFDDLFHSLTRLVESGDLSNRECLHCIQTALTLLIDQGSAFNIDPSKFYMFLYKTLLSFNFKNLHSDLPAALSCLDLMINKRKKHVSDHRCMAFIKRISISTLQVHPSGVIPLLAMIKNIIQNYPKCDSLLDDECIGSGSYQPEVDNPDHCNAQNTNLYELSLFVSSYDPNVRTYSNFVLHNLSGEGPHKLPSNLSRISSADLFRPDFSHVVNNIKMKELQMKVNNNSTVKQHKNFTKRNNLKRNSTGTEK